MFEKETLGIRFYFTPEAYARLEAMRLVTGVKTDADVIRNALRAYEWIVNRAAEEATVQVRSTTGGVTAMFKAKLLLSEEGEEGHV